MSDVTITADKTPWYQWDTGLTVTVSGGEMTECHFANRKQGTAYVQAVIKGKAKVPDELLQVAAPITAYGYVEDEAGAQTRVEVAFDVKARNIPSGYTYTKTAQKTIRDAEVARDEAVQAAKDAKASALAADDSAIKASKSAQSAGESASAAATSASNAAKSAGEAAKSASDAKAAAGKVVEDASELLKTYTDDAKTSADNAATSADASSGAASAASRSAGEAKQSATDANSAKVAAQTAKAEAEAAKGEAATSASNAESSATAAAKSASDAAASVNAINVIAPKTVETGAAVTVTNNTPIAIGLSAVASQDYATAFGMEAVASGNGALAIGRATKSSGFRSVALGGGATASFDHSYAIGSSAVTSKSHELSLGSIDNVTTTEITHVSTPTAPTSASTKKYTDDNDSKTLTEAKKYTDDNTTNALIGKVSGKLLHVEDAWPSTFLGVEIEGATEQVTTMGKNLLNGCDSYFKEADATIKNYLWGYSLSLNPCVLDKPLEPGEYTFSVYSNAGCAIYLSKKPYVTGQYANFSATQVINGDTRFGLKRYYCTFTLTDTCELLGIFADNYQACFGGMIEKGITVSAYEPYTGGKPSPSLDYPQEITVIENPVLKVTGRNLQPYPFAFHHKKVETINGITFTDNGDGSITASGTAEGITFYNLDFTTDAKFLRDVKVTASMSKYLNFSVECFGADNSIKPVTGNVNVPASFPSDAQMLRNYIYLSSGKTVNTTVYPQFEYGDKATSYRPYVSKTLPITLPAEHPYLAALSDGTHDEIVIDKDGNAKLVARIGIDRDVREIETFTQGQYYNLKTTIKAFASANTSYSGGEMCSALLSRNTSPTKEGIYRTWTGVYVKDTSGRTREEIQADIDKNAPLTIAVKIPETVYQLGKLTIPSLPETISNVWIDAELTTDMSMTYKQDVNVVIAGLTAQINALKGSQRAARGYRSNN